jgi:hypothetical protein
MIHSWLYLKGLYPAEAFVSRNLFGVNIKSAGENSLKTYIHDFITSIEDLHYKGILHSISLLLVKDSKILENFVLRITWIMNVYTSADNDKVLSQVHLENFFGKVLNDFYAESVQDNKDKTFQIVIETVKEEASEAEEVLSRENWVLVSQDCEKCEESRSVTGIFNLEWGYVKILS